MSELKTSLKRFDCELGAFGCPFLMSVQTFDLGGSNVCFALITSASITPSSSSHQPHPSVPNCGVAAEFEIVEGAGESFVLAVALSEKERAAFWACLLVRESCTALAVAGMWLHDGGRVSSDATLPKISLLMIKSVGQLSGSPAGMDLLRFVQFCGQV